MGEGGGGGGKAHHGELIALSRGDALTIKRPASPGGIPRTSHICGAPKPKCGAQTSNRTQDTRTTTSEIPSLRPSASIYTMVLPKIRMQNLQGVLCPPLLGAEGYSSSTAADNPLATGDDPQRQGRRDHESRRQAAGDGFLSQEHGREHGSTVRGRPNSGEQTNERTDEQTDG